MAGGDSLVGQAQITLFPSEHLFRSIPRRVGPAGAFVAGTVLYVVVPVVAASFDGTLFIARGLFSSENQYIYLLPALFATVAHYHRESAYLLDKLVARGVLTTAPNSTSHASTPADHAQHAQIARIVERVSASPLSRIGALIPFVIAILTPLMFLLNGADPAIRPGFVRAIVGDDRHAVGWLFAEDGIRPIAYYFSVVFHGVGMAVLAAWAFSHLRAARVLRQLFDEANGVRVNLRILHPDGCMGLGPVSELVRHCAVVLVLISLVVFLWTTGFLLVGDGFRALADPGFLTAWGCYVTFAPLLFFAPLVSARRQMWLLKERTLAALGQRIFATPDLEETVKWAGQYAPVQDARVWPFTVATVSSFVASLGGPLVITAISELVKGVVENVR